MGNIAYWYLPLETLLISCFTKQAYLDSVAALNKVETKA